MDKYKWSITQDIYQLIIELELIKLVIDHLPTNPQFEENYRQHSLLKSAVFSARIEGFTDTLNNPKKESQNLVSAYRYIFSKEAPLKVSTKFIKKIHSIVLKDLSTYSGQWRTEPWAIFDQSGSAIYLAPLHTEVPNLMDEYIELLRELKEHPSVNAAIAQFIFEKIHPFADGNGRVGRLISTFLLHKNNLNFKGLAPFEEYIDKHRDDYYYSLEPGVDCTKFIKFFLEALISQSKEYLSKTIIPIQIVPEDSLMPRRRELLEIIRDHPQRTFNFLQRRFAGVNSKTLHNDLLRLQKMNFIKKLGSTNGVMYISNFN